MCGNRCIVPGADRGRLTGEMDEKEKLAFVEFLSISREVDFANSRRLSKVRDESDGPTKG